MSMEANHDPARAPRGRPAITTIALVGDDLSSRDEILAALAQIPEPVVEVVELKANKGETHTRPPEVVIVALSDDEETWMLQIQELKEGAPRRAVIGAISEHSGSQVRQALRAGADDVFFLPVEPSDLSRCLVRL